MKDRTRCEAVIDNLKAASGWVLPLICSSAMNRPGFELGRFTRAFHRHERRGGDFCVVSGHKGTEVRGRKCLIVTMLLLDEQGRAEEHEFHEQAPASLTAHKQACEPSSHPMAPASSAGVALCTRPVRHCRPVTDAEHDVARSKTTGHGTLKDLSSRTACLALTRKPTKAPHSLRPLGRLLPSFQHQVLLAP